NSNVSKVRPTPVATMTPSSVVLPSNGFFIANSQLTVASTVPSAGNYTVVVRGTSGNLTRTVSVVVNIMDFSISANPTSLSMSVVSSGTSTLTLTSVNGFNGNRSLTTHLTPTDLTAATWPVAQS